MLILFQKYCKDDRSWKDYKIPAGVTTIPAVAKQLEGVETTPGRFRVVTSDGEIYRIDITQPTRMTVTTTRVTDAD